MNGRRHVLAQDELGAAAFPDIELLVLVPRVRGSKRVLDALPNRLERLQKKQIRFIFWAVDGFDPGTNLCPMKGSPRQWDLV